MYPIDRRKLAIHVYSLFSSLRKTAKILQVSHSTVSRWLKSPNKKQYTRTQVSKSKLIIETIKNAITNDPFITVLALKAIIYDTFDFQISKELIRSALKSLNMSRKKAKFISVTKDLHIKTKKFLDERQRLQSKGYTFYSIDETSFGRHGKPVMGYSIKGTPLKIIKKEPRMTSVSSLVLISENAIVNRCMSTKPFNTIKFLEFLKACNFKPNSVLLLDNVSFHHSHVVKQFATDKNLILLYVPPYSPWYNPIEGVFSIIKRHFYKTGNIEESFAMVNAKHIEAFFKDSWKIV